MRPNRQPANGFFVTGTDTDVGKTYVGCRIAHRLLAQRLVVAAYKPVASGAASIEESDAYKLWHSTGCHGTLEMVNPQSFRAPLAPPIAAELENRAVDDSLILRGVELWTGECNVLVVEGAGGLLSPISWNLTNADLAVALGYPLIVVARNRLGVVHQVLSVVQIANALGLRIAEVVLNQTERPMRDSDAAVETNEKLLRVFLDRVMHGIPIRHEPFGEIAPKSLLGVAAP
jgi:dethiobiotin synthetase